MHSRLKSGEETVETNIHYTCSKIHNACSNHSQSQTLQFRHALNRRALGSRMYSSVCHVQYRSQSSFPLTSGWKTRALGVTISGMCHRCRLRNKTRWAEFGYFLCYFKMIAPSLSFSDRWSRGTKALVTRLYHVSIVSIDVAN